ENFKVYMVEMQTLVRPLRYGAGHDLRAYARPY
ncbi:hypothetical protein AWZ03_014956, partial [Drosophila navojoa]